MQTPDWTDYVDRAAEAIGQDPSHGRLLHARGTWLTGTWSPVDGSTTQPAVARFSGTLGGPGGHDASTGDQGVLISLGTPGSSAELTLALFTLPAFFVRTGQDMLEFLAATSPRLSPEQGERAMAAFVERHPESLTALGRAGGPPPTSFLDRVYHSVHAYGVPLDGANSWQRLELVPTSEAGPDPTDPGSLPADYLHQDLVRRLPVTLRLFARAPGDGEQDDVTQAWEKGATTLLGEVTLNASIDAVTPEPDLSTTGTLLPPRDELFSDRVAAYRAARAARSSPT